MIRLQTIRCGTEEPPFASDARNADAPIPRALLDSAILVVEDEAMIAWMLESLLEDMGFADIRIAASGEQALVAATDAMPALVVSDINLGAGQDGIDTAARLQQLASTPVVFISGYAGEEERERIERVTPGAAVLRKPVDAALLKQAVAAALKTRAVN